MRRPPSRRSRPRLGRRLHPFSASHPPPPARWQSGFAVMTRGVWAMVHRASWDLPTRRATHATRSSSLALSSSMSRRCGFGTLALHQMKTRVDQLRDHQVIGAIAYYANQTNGGTSLRDWEHDDHHGRAIREVRAEQRFVLASELIRRAEDVMTKLKRPSDVASLLLNVSVLAGKSMPPPESTVLMKQLGTYLAIPVSLVEAAENKLSKGNIDRRYFTEMSVVEALEGFGKLGYRLRPTLQAKLGAVLDAACERAATEGRLGMMDAVLLSRCFKASARLVATDLMTIERLDRLMGRYNMKAALSVHANTMNALTLMGRVAHARNLWDATVVRYAAGKPRKHMGWEMGNLYKTWLTFAVHHLHASCRLGPRASRDGAGGCFNPGADELRASMEAEGGAHWPTTVDFASARRSIIYPAGMKLSNKSSMETDVADTLVSLGHVVQPEFELGIGFYVDMLVDGDTVVEVDGPWHFFANDPRQYNAYCSWRRLLMAAIGCKLVCVPYFEWNTARGDTGRRAYILRKLDKHSRRTAAPIGGDDDDSPLAAWPAVLPLKAASSLPPLPFALSSRS